MACRGGKGSVSISVQLRPLLQNVENQENGRPRNPITTTDKVENVFVDAILKYSSYQDVLLATIDNLIHIHWESGDEINMAKSDVPEYPDDQRWMPLHFAAYLNNVQLVKALCQHPKINLMARDEENDTPLHVASYWDHTHIIEVLLTNSEKNLKLEELINAQNDKLDTPFSYAASRFHTNTCKSMLDYIPPLNMGMEYKDDDSICKRSPDQFAKLPNETLVAEFLEKNKPLIDFHQETKHESSPINILIAKIPNIVKEILDKSILETKIASLDMDGEKRKHKNTYRMLVDFGCLECYKGQENPDDADRYEQVGAVYQTGNYKDGDNPLQVMVREQRSELLKHPVVDALILKKWNSFGRDFFYAFTFMFYILFFIMLLIYEFFQIKPYVSESDGESFRARIENLTHPCTDTSTGCYKEKPLLCIVSGYFVFVMASARLFLELLDLLNETFVKAFSTSSTGGKSKKPSIPYRTFMRGLMKYVTSLTNILELLLYSEALFFSLNIFDDDVITPVSWQIGVFCVFLSFLNLLQILQVVPGVGLYIIMFLRILRTFISKIAALLLFFIVHFAVIFHMLLSQSTAVNTFLSGESVYKTITQGVSGIEADDYDASLIYPEASLVGLVVFAIFVQVLFLNLATGLAIADVKEIRAEAKAEMSAIKIQHIYHAERLLATVQALLNRFPLLKNQRLLPCQKRFQNMPTQNFKLEKIQDIREAREKIENKGGEFENKRREIASEKELQQLKNELEAEIKAVKNCINDFEDKNNKIKEELCADVTVLKDIIHYVKKENRKQVGDVESDVANLSCTIDKLTNQNKKLDELFKEIKIECFDKSYTMKRPTHTRSVCPSDRSKTILSTHDYKSVSPSDSVKHLLSSQAEYLEPFGHTLEPDSEIQKLKRRLKTEIVSLKYDIIRVSQKNENLKENVKVDIFNAKYCIEEFSSENKTKIGGLKENINNEQIKIILEVKKNEERRDAMIEVKESLSKIQPKKEMQQLKNELRAEIKAVKNCINDFEKSNNKLKEELCCDVTDLNYGIHNLKAESRKHVGDVESDFTNLSCTIDELTSQNITLGKLLKEIMFKYCNETYPFSSLTNVGVRDGISYTNRSICPSEVMKLSHPHDILTPQQSFSDTDSEMQKIGRELKAEIISLEGDIFRVSQENENFKEKINFEIIRVKNGINGFSEEMESDNSGLKKIVKLEHNVTKLLVEKNKELIGAMLHVSKKICKLMILPSVTTEEGGVL